MADDIGDDATGPSGDPEDADGTTTHEPSAPPRHKWNWKRWLRVGTPILIVAILGVEGYLAWPHLLPAWERIGDIRWGWIAACGVAAMLSMDSYAQVQRVLMRSAGVRVRQGESLAVILASNSISQTMPGGQVLAPAFIYRESRKWGASPVVASWQLVMSGLLSAAGLAVLGFGGAMLAGSGTNPFTLVMSVTAFVAFAIVMQYLASHPESLEGLGRRVLGWVNSLRDRPTDHGVPGLHRLLEQLRSVHLGRRYAAEAFGWSLFNWVADVACLAFACYAIGAHPGIFGLMVAYALGKAVGSTIPLLPGGLGVVDLVLLPPLISAGMSAPDAIIAILLYRIISWLLVALIGWVVIAVRYRSEIKSRDDLRSEMEREEDDIESPPATA